MNTVTSLFRAEDILSRTTYVQKVQRRGRAKRPSKTSENNSGKSYQVISNKQSEARRRVGLRIKLDQHFLKCVGLGQRSQQTALYGAF